MHSPRYDVRLSSVVAVDKDHRVMGLVVPGYRRHSRKGFELGVGKDAYGAAAVAIREPGCRASDASAEDLRGLGYGMSAR